MATVCSDNFNRTVYPLASIPVAPAGKDWAIGGGTWGANGTTAYQSSGWGSPFYWHVTVDSLVSDCIVSAKVATLEASWGLYVRYVDVNNWYWVSNSDVGALKIMKAQAGVFTTVATNAYVLAVNDIMSVELSGDNFVVKINGTTKISYSNHFQYNATKHGMGAFGYGTQVNARWDDFLVTAAMPPTITSLSVTDGSTAGTYSTVITGTNFTGTTAVQFGGVNATSFSVASTTQITATVPAHAAGAVNVTATNPDGTGTLTNGFTYHNPTLSACTPNTGTISGGTAITNLAGQYLTGVTGVTFGGSAGTSFVLVSDTQITCVSPAHAAGAVNVVVTNSHSDTGTLSNGFTYVVQPTTTAISPNVGKLAGGTPVTITGTNYAGSPTVNIGGTACTSVVVVNSTTITCLTGAKAAGTYDVNVVQAGLTGTLVNGFIYSAPKATVTFTGLDGTTSSSTVIVVVDGYTENTNIITGMKIVLNPNTAQSTDRAMVMLGMFFAKQTVPGAITQQNFGVINSKIRLFHGFNYPTSAPTTTEVIPMFTGFMNNVDTACSGALAVISCSDLTKTMQKTTLESLTTDNAAGKPNMAYDGRVSGNWFVSEPVSSMINRILKYCSYDVNPLDGTTPFTNITPVTFTSTAAISVVGKPLVLDKVRSLYFNAADNLYYAGLNNQIITSPDLLNWTVAISTAMNILTIFKHPTNGNWYLLQGSIDDDQVEQIATWDRTTNTIKQVFHLTPTACYKPFNNQFYSTKNDQIVLVGVFKSSPYYNYIYGFTCGAAGITGRTILFGAPSGTYGRYATSTLISIFNDGTNDFIRCAATQYSSLGVRYMYWSISGAAVNGQTGNFAITAEIVNFLSMPDPNGATTDPSKGLIVGLYQHGSAAVSIDIGDITAGGSGWTSRAGTGRSAAGATYANNRPGFSFYSDHVFVPTETSLIFQYSEGDILKIRINPSYASMGYDSLSNSVPPVTGDVFQNSNFEVSPAHVLSPLRLNAVSGNTANTLWQWSTENFVVAVNDPATNKANFNNDYAFNDIKDLAQAVDCVQFFDESGKYYFAPRPTKSYPVDMDLGRDGDELELKDTIGDSTTYQLFNQVNVDVNSGISQTALDASSTSQVKTFGRLADTVSNSWIYNSTLALMLASSRLGLFDLPKNLDDTTFRFLPLLSLMNKVTLIHPYFGIYRDQVFMVHRITHNNRGSKWTTHILVRRLASSMGNG